MSYLHPPPGDAPVVVMKDVGGYVDQYEQQTAWYSQTNREVRLHECRSACTLALSLPNVCVYPDSLLKFHKAYNPETKEANDSVSDALMASYPSAVRERLGVLTRNYKVLTGSELIRLGVRDCNAPRGPRIMIARARPKQMTPEDPVSNTFGALVAALTPPTLPPQPQVKVASVRTESAPAPEASYAAPLPPQRPQDLTPPPAPAPIALPAPQSASPAPQAQPQAPTPPPRPAELAAPAAPKIAAPPGVMPPTAAWGRPIRGSAAILATARFSPFPYRIISRI
jgi:hypothetical protein